MYVSYKGRDIMRLV